jgi:hypothetical protein
MDRSVSSATMNAMHIRPKDLTELRMRYAEGKLALFIGAGVSVSCGLPDWNTLASLVIDEAIYVDPAIGSPGHVYSPRGSFRRMYLKGLSPLESLRIVRAEVKADFASVVRRALYKTSPRSSATVTKLASLSGCSRVCNFNYDFLLELELAKVSRPFIPVAEGVAFSLLQPETLVFHPHGFLPGDSDAHEFTASLDVILSEDDYHRLYAAPYSWASVVQIALLMNYSVLFVGFSLADPNTRRLLDIVKSVGSSHRHFAVLKDPTLEIRRAEAGSWFPSSPTALALSEASLLGRGVAPVWIDSYDEIPAFIDRLSSP